MSDSRLTPGGNFDHEPHSRTTLVTSRTYVFAATHTIANSFSPSMSYDRHLPRYPLMCLEGTLIARHQSEQQNDCIVRDTTGDEIVQRQQRNVT